MNPLLDLLRALHAADVRAIVVGGVAVQDLADIVALTELRDDTGTDDRA